MSKASIDPPVFIACNISNGGGEGRLANLYALNRYGVTLAPCNETSLKKLVSGQVLSPVISPRSRWRNSLSAYSWLLSRLILLHFQPVQNVVVLNYLPLWNFLFFLLAPRWVKTAPITGGGQVNMRHLNLAPFPRIMTNLIRNIFIPMLYKISATLIKVRRLQVVPATLAVANALGMDDQNSRFIETDAAPFAAHDGASQIVERDYDLIAYIGAHPLKNSALTIAVVNNLAQRGRRIAIIGGLGGIHDLHDNVSCFRDVSRETVFGIIQQSRAALSLSLEQAGFFTYEAAAFGLPVLCLPNSGGATLPGACLLASSDEVLSPDFAASRAQDILVELQDSTATQRHFITTETRKVQQNAAAFYHQS